MDYLPTDDEQRALVHGLYDLLAHRGVGPFVSAPIVEPTSTFFPDRWAPNARGARTLLLRLLAYAGLDALDVDVHVFENPARQATWGAPAWHRGVAGWFAGIEEGVCRFGIDGRKLDDPEALTGVLCHEVAHAYRAHHGLMDMKDRDAEEKLTDLTTIYLGFGIFTVNNTDRHRAHGDSQSRRVTQEHHGYLSPQEMCFLFAAQAVGRRLGAREQRRLAGLLEPNQAACFETACEQLGADPDKLARRLGLPPRAVWPKARPLEEIIRPLRDEPAEGEHADEEPAEDTGSNEEQPSTQDQADAEQPEPEAPEDPAALSELDAHIVRLRAVPAIARARREHNNLELHRLVRARRARAKGLAEEAALDWILRDPRPHMRPVKSRPWFGLRLWTGIALHDAGARDPEDRSHVINLRLEVMGIPIVPIASYVVRGHEGRDLEFLGRVPLAPLLRTWRGFVVALALLPLLWAVPAIVESRRGKVHLVNGLDIPVVVSIGGERVTMVAGERDVRVLPRGHYRAKTTAEDGRVIEEQDVDVGGGDHFVAYNVAGAAAIYARQIVYGNTSVPPASAVPYLGRKIIERDDIELAFVAPPDKLDRERRFWSIVLIPDGWRASVSALVADGARDRAAELLAAISLAEPFDEKALDRALDAAMAQGGIERALAHVARVIERAPDSEIAHRSRQYLLSRAGRPGEAHAIYQRMHAEQPGSALAAYLHIRLEPTSEQLRLLPDLVRAHPSSVALHVMLGWTQVTTGHPEAGLPELERASVLAPTQRSRWIAVHAQALVALGRVAEATALVASVVDEGKELRLAVLYGRLARLEGAHPPQPHEQIFAKLTGGRATADERMFYLALIGEIEAARTGLSQANDPVLRQATEIELTATTDPTRAARLAADANDGPRLLDEATSVLLAAELARAGDPSAVERLLQRIPRLSNPDAIAAYILGRPNAVDVAAFSLDMQAALRFADALRRGVKGPALEAVRREALALDPLHGSVTRVITATRL